MSIRLIYSTINISFVGNYTGIKTIDFVIKPADATDAVISEIEDQAYTGKAVMPDLMVYLDDVQFKDGIDYTVTYANNIEVGPAKTFVSFIGNYTRTTALQVSFNIVYKWDEGVVTKKPTCTEEGEMTYTCTADSSIKKTEKIEPLGHKWKDDYTVDKAATCTEEGVESIHCAVCDTIQENSSRIIRALDHKWKAPTYTWSIDNSEVTATKMCEHNNSHIEEETVSTTSEVTKPATYTEKGETTYMATFTNSAFTTQIKVVANIDQLPKLTNTITAKGKKVNIKYTKIKNKAQSITAKKAYTVSKAIGTKSYKLSSVSKSKFKKYFKVDVKSGKITIKKGLKRGTYKVKVKITAAGNDQYKSRSKTATLTVNITK